MTSLVTKLVDAVDIGGAVAPGVISLDPNTSGTKTATSLYPQRVSDETGSIQVEVNQDTDPAAGSDGEVNLQGRLDPNAGWATIATVDLTDFDGATILTKIVTGIPLVTEMQISVDLEAGPYAVAAGTDLTVWFQE